MASVADHDKQVLLRRVQTVAIAMMTVQGVALTLFPPLLAYFSQLFGLSPFGSGLMVGFYMVGVILGGVLAPLLVNIVTLKPLAMITVGLAALGMLITGLSDSFPMLSVGRAIAGFGNSLLWITSFTWVLSVNDGPGAPRALSVVVGISSIGNLLGPLVGPLAIKHGFDTVFFAVSGLTLLLILPMSRLSAPQHLSKAGNHLALLFRARPIRSVVMVNLVRTLAMGAMLVLLPLLLTREGFASHHIAVTFIAGALLSFPLAYLFGLVANRFGVWPTMRVILTVIVLIPLPIPMLHSDALIFSLAALLIGLMTAAPVVFSAAFSEVAPPDPEAGIRHIELMSWSLIIAGTGQLIGSVFGGFLLEFGSFMLALGVIAAIALLAVGRASPALRAARDGNPSAAH